MSTKVIILTLIVLAIIVVVYKLKNQKQTDVILPADSINVSELAKQLENDLEVEDVAIEDVSVEELESTTEAIIADLATEAEESLPESLNPSVTDLSISESDKAELESLLSGDSLILGAMRSLGLRSLGLTLSPIEKSLLPPKEITDLVQPPPLPAPESVTQLISSPIPEEDDLQHVQQQPLMPKPQVEPPTTESTPVQQVELEKIKETVVTEEAKKINTQEHFINTQVKNVNETIKAIRKEGEEEIKLIRKESEQNPELKIANDARIQQIKEEVEIRQLDLSEKSEELKALAKEKKTLANDVLNKKVTPKRVKKIKFPRKSKKGRVNSVKTKLESGGSSLKLNIPSDLNPEESDEINIEISKESEETLAKYEIIKSKIIRDGSMGNVSKEEKQIIKSAGVAFKDIKAKYIKGRTEKIRGRKNKIKALKSN